MNLESILIKIIQVKNANEFRNYTGLFTFINSYSYSVIRRENNLINQFDGVFFDGFLMARMIGLITKRKIVRVSFDMTSLAPVILKYAINENKSIYFIGAKKDEIDRFIQIISFHFPGINIAGFRDGYFESDDRNTILNSIKSINPDIVIVGMGTPLQERFLVDLKKVGWSGLGFTCGGFLHQTSNKLHYYPNWVNNLNLRWLYRLYDEPKLIKRFVKSYFVFPFLLIFDFIMYRRLK